MPCRINHHNVHGPDNDYLLDYDIYFYYPNLGDIIITNYQTKFHPGLYFVAQSVGNMLPIISRWVNESNN